ncbi:DUF3043 domain-containing protein [Actinacidiphila bryophytorum]|uniref:DUF3043 domain-containing protein n=1 Tax=Actinacidiphila bryophytorum TaxID=1436133 RepID=A0A9W4EDK7_9ACTN|nr:DUF3043 domain-containing protein [Actinacidiphila bryophytorum]MBM9436333.1 DUF3043 domain-containing protein [Actinacidiphila bryophytorum]MBN6543911.1 DUF3043 domain-containing protein [Actinacidiphila bryophytorum]CAG7631656.1 conserved hypothetical protein [Actinacidiphila bryophytorum]
MFRRRSEDEQALAVAAVLEDQTRDPQAPKGRPTPKRSEAQQQRRKAANTPTDRKAAAKQAREARRVDLAKRREALANGDERHLPAAHQGPVRKFTRDYVDSRYRVAEFFLPMAVLILIGSLMPAVQTLSLFLWVLVIVLILIDSVITGFALRRQLAKRFPDQNTKRAVTYGLMRTLQMRRMRLPKPQVQRGAKL